MNKKNGFVVTGGTGFIGRAFVQYCISIGEKVLVVVRPTSKNIDRIPQSNLVSILKYDLETNLNEENLPSGYTFFVNFAWNHTDREGRFDTKGQTQNILSTIKAVELAKKLGCSKFIGIGSQAEYGLVNGTIDENTATSPVIPYGICKLASCQLAKIRCQQLKLEFNWIRVFSVYGFGDHSGTLLDSLISAIREKKTINLSSGEQSWNYLFIDDVAEGVFQLALFGQNNEIYNLANFEQFKLKEYLYQVVDIFDKDYILSFDKNNNGQSLNVNMEKVAKTIDWRPKVSFFEGMSKIKAKY